MNFLFGPFELQRDERRLLSGGEALSISPRAFDLLVTLVEHGGRLLTKDELLDRVWPRMVVEENALQAQVSALRKVLGSDAIATVARSGYRFTLPIVRGAAVPRETALRHNLPQPSTSFIGRDKEIVQTRLLLGRSRLLTLTGAGGCGKTRLAIQVAQGLTQAYPEGIWFVELASLADPSLVAPALASALGVQERPGHSLTQLIAEHLSNGRALIVLDNAEHLSEAVSSLVDELLVACEHAVFFVTSRQPLRVAGETTHRVPSLSVPDPRHDTTPSRLSTFESVQLFVDRARLQRPHFAVTPDIATAVASICHRLDGIPLAIELAAPRLRTMPVEEIDRRLDQRFGLLTNGPRTSLHRQRTLRAMIDWSHDLLTEPEQALMRRSSVFAGGWTLEAAEAACLAEGEDPATILGLLGLLADKNLIQAEEEPDGAPRYRMLESIRQYAQERLRESGEVTTWQRKHAQWLSSLSRECWDLIEGPRRPEVLKTLEVEHENIRAALTWSLESTPADQKLGLEISGACGRFWIARGYFREGRGWLMKFLDACLDDGSTHRHAVALSGAGVLAYLQRDWPDANKRFESASAIWHSLGDRALSANCMMNLGAVQFELGNFTEAMASISQSAHIAREVGNELVLGNCLQWLGDISRQQQDLPACRRWYEEALIVARKIGHPMRTATAILRLGILANCERHFALAKSLLLEGLTLLQALADIPHVSGALAELALVAQALDHPDRSVRLFAAAERARQEVDGPLTNENEERQQRVLKELRESLGNDAEFERAWQEGQAMAWMDAIQYARDAW